MQEAPRDADDAGPDSELTYWRNRMAKFNSVAEQLKSKGTCCFWARVSEHPKKPSAKMHAHVSSCNCA